LWALIILLLAVPLISGGKCAFFFSSGGSDDDDDEEQKEGLTVIVKEGEFVDAPVAGLRYESGSVSGVTGSGGEFLYEAGNTVRFSLGDIDLGQAVAGKALITPLDLVPDGDLDSTAAINIARLLQSLDAVRGDGAITIPESVHATALLDNELLAAAIEHLDFGDDDAFVNAASQLVAVLTGEYDFTASLIDPEAAREHLRRMLSGLKVDEDN
jgi:para-nitrobenzyl esterase